MRIFFKKLLSNRYISRGRAVVARQAHNLEAGGPNPSPATVLSDILTNPGRTIADLGNVQCGLGLKVIVSIATMMVSITKI